MADKTKIAWTDATWTPVRARVIAGSNKGRMGPHCERVSPGCSHCYSESNNLRCLPYNGTGLTFTRGSRDLVEIFLDQRILEQPLHWRRPRKIFVCSQTDLFGGWVPDEMIEQVFSVMALCHQHDFQVLTKRARRLRDYSARNDKYQWCWPLHNVWFGVSVEDRARKNRVDYLRETPAAMRFLSLEPLLEDLGTLDLRGIDWVIIGGESGRNARPCDMAWIRSLVAQCRRAGCLPYVKQLGAVPLIDRNRWHNDQKILAVDETYGSNVRLLLNHRSGADPDEWPAELRVRETP